MNRRKTGNWQRFPVVKISLQQTWFLSNRSKAWTQKNTRYKSRPIEPYRCDTPNEHRYVSTPQSVSRQPRIRQQRRRHTLTHTYTHSLCRQNTTQEQWRDHWGLGEAMGMAGWRPRKQDILQKTQDGALAMPRPALLGFHIHFVNCVVTRAPDTSQYVSLWIISSLSFHFPLCLASCFHTLVTSIHKYSSGYCKEALLIVNGQERTLLSPHSRHTLNSFMLHPLFQPLRSEGQAVTMGCSWQWGAARPLLHATVWVT